ncbi:MULTISPECIES: GyrI-like domain-containing protein [Erysipelothrix]|uniref:Integron-associated effector binding protein domain-containing protein n=1 Tax=Erysipelothrix piscisicarius TaxID=2485784 RepID=A0A3Q8S2N1_9FIRM|nr:MULTISPECIES: effector binding domain-containing protein [Erysipelothrix]AZK44056.1 hypothetical protein EEI45_04155 [Erysipelothrix piscisicarius]MBK2402813.1 hypothetical protein [Erysipelothrix sp. strain 2 (EsS2-6-Brazil)]MBK2404096.1 hypothetical protein [Erysipelothrix sp. strain 2 (EsS2-7-Brazil)]NBA01693.1 hypothetical protein [Erysipelothrix rhusiopathiae]
MNLFIREDIRTNSFDDPEFEQKLASMWERFNTSLPHYDAAKYAVYTDYKTDYKGLYSLGLATEFEQTSELLVVDERNDYQVFPVDVTDEFGVLNTWKLIWSLEASDKLKRAYTIDFEKYYEDGRIDIFIAVE